MIIHKTHLDSAVVVDADPVSDQRGFFSRLYCSRELASVIGERQIVNVNFSRTSKKGTIRGLHFQCQPHQEMKLVRCVRGAVYDVIVDIRRDSPSYLQWHAELLTESNMKMIVAPEGFAHGFQALEDGSEVLYLATAFYEPSSEGGLLYNDPILDIPWPLAVSDISKKDSSHPMLSGIIT